MSGSFYRMTSPTPRSVPQSRWHASRDAADILDDMAENLSAMTEARTMLAIYPGDAEWRIKARNAARLFVVGCDDLESLS